MRSITNRSKGPLPGLQLEPELLLHGGENGGAAIGFRRHSVPAGLSRAGTGRQIAWRRPVMIPIPLVAVAASKRKVKSYFASSPVISTTGRSSWFESESATISTRTLGAMDASRLTASSADAIRDSPTAMPANARTGANREPATAAPAATPLTDRRRARAPGNRRGTGGYGTHGTGCTDRA